MRPAPSSQVFCWLDVRAHRRATRISRIRYGGTSWRENWIEWGNWGLNGLLSVGHCWKTKKKKPHKHLDQLGEGGNIKGNMMSVYSLFSVGNNAHPNGFFGVFSDGSRSVWCGGDRFIRQKMETPKLNWSDKKFNPLGILLGVGWIGMLRCTSDDKGIRDATA